MIQAVGISKSYGMGDGRVGALLAIDLTIESGEFVAIMGPSGSGKSTLLNLLSGIDVPDTGEVIIEGQSLQALNDNQRTEFRARRMGYVFQTYNLVPVLTAVENTELPLILAGVHPAAARRQALEMLKLVNLSDRAQHRPAQLSGGQCQRVAIARAFVNSPAILWADEPTGALDSESATQVMKLLVAANRERGQTIVLVTHSHEVANMASREIHLRDGRIQQTIPQPLALRG